MKDQTLEKMDTAIEQVQQEVDSGCEPSYCSSQRTRILAVINLIQVVLFTALAWFVHFNPVIPIDVAITQEFQEISSPWLQSCMIAVSFLGNQSILFAGLIALTALAFWFVRLRLEALIILTLSGVSLVTNVLVKVLVNRPRPTTQLVSAFQQTTGQSFPSGHVMSYIAFWGLLFAFGVSTGGTTYS